MFEFIKKIIKKTKLILVDVFLLNLSLAVSFFMRFDTAWLSYFDYSHFIILSLVGFAVLYYSNLYNKLWRYASVEELFSIIKASIAINLLLVFYIFIARTSFPRSVILSNFMVDIFVLGISRFVLRIFTDYITRTVVHGSGTRVLIIGAGDAGEIIIREMNKHPEMKKHVIGLIDDDPK
ncbi:MAG: hypothetical protein GX175_08170 [Halanaerobiaceae bacterium]|nr:hypothetical protein [Halanaerobiaceae bacterium]